VAERDLNNVFVSAWAERPVSEITNLDVLETSTPRSPRAADGSRTRHHARSTDRKRRRSMSSRSRAHRDDENARPLRLGANSAGMDARHGDRDRSPRTNPRTATAGAVLSPGRRVSEVLLVLCSGELLAPCGPPNKPRRVTRPVHGDKRPLLLLHADGPKRLFNTTGLRVIN
jgi:hypothetical protein